MPVDKEFTYEVITALRDAVRNSDGYLKILLRTAANIMENNIRAYLDLLEDKR